MSADNMNVRQRLAAVLLADTVALRWALGWVAMLLTAGLAFGAADTSNYGAINRLQPLGIWMALFGAYAVCHLAACLYRLPTAVMYVCGVLGLWLWSYLFLSFVVFDRTPVQATEVMLIVPLIAEVWILAGDIFERRGSK